MRVLAPIKVFAGAAAEEEELGRVDGDAEADGDAAEEAGATLLDTGTLLAVAMLAMELETLATSVLAATALAEDERGLPVCLHRLRRLWGAA